MVVEKECLNAVLRPIPTANLVSALVANAEVLNIHTGLMKIVVDAEPQIARQQNGGFLMSILQARLQRLVNEAPEMLKLWEEVISEGV